MNNTTFKTSAPLQYPHSVEDILWNGVALYTTTIAAIIHLAALCKQLAELAIYSILASMTIPLYALAEVTIGVYRTFKAWR